MGCRLSLFVYPKCFTAVFHFLHTPNVSLLSFTSCCLIAVFHFLYTPNVSLPSFTFCIPQMSHCRLSLFVYPKCLTAIFHLLLSHRRLSLFVYPKCLTAVFHFLYTPNVSLPSFTFCITQMSHCRLSLFAYPKCITAVFHL